MSHIDDIEWNVEECNANKKCNMLIVFDDMIADMVSNIKFKPIVTDLLLEVEN